MSRRRFVTLWALFAVGTILSAAAPAVALRVNLFGFVAGLAAVALVLDR